MNKGRFERYEHKNVEQKWQKKWGEMALNRTQEDPAKPKCYVLDMFPYPSGDGLHVGHPKGYIATDVYTRFKRMRGFNILHPMGWDAFGLPAEQFALKNKVHPSVAVAKNCARFKEQLEKIGFNYDWEREINTTDPSYYKWTQWIFLKLFERGLAYQSNEPINWCPSCLTGLANEDLDGDKCERCGTKVEQKPIRQWVLRITDYADRMLSDLDTLEWPTSIKESQRNWIGKSVGAMLHFEHAAAPAHTPPISVFTTRPDTLFGVTYIAISAKLALKYFAEEVFEANAELKQFANQIIADESRAVYGEVAEKKGVFTGYYVIHPITGAKIPLWIANYVLGNYGTGAVMGVPAHDERDFDFAKQYDIPMKMVVCPVYPSPTCPVLDHAFEDDGHLVNSGDFDGMPNRDAIPGIIAAAKGEPKTQYRLKDWVFARQRYWGEPIPLVFQKGTDVAYPVDMTDLPVVLPEVEFYEPTGTGESPLANISEWVNVEGYVTEKGTFKLVTKEHPAPEGVTVQEFRRETNTMPQWAGSSWYYLRYIDPKNNDALIDPKREHYWSPVDVYVGGAEHATRHLIYARFWHKVLFDAGVVSKPEPFARLQNVGLIMASDGRKMSKRYGNVINPDDVIETFGADSLRLYEMFMGPFDQPIAWSTDNMVGARRFIERVWKLADRVGDIEEDGATEVLMNQTIAKVGADIEAFKFNTAISQLMICINGLEKLPAIPLRSYRALLLLLSPFAPHITEEIWSLFGESESIHLQQWPIFDAAKTETNTVPIAVQIAGKLRDTFHVERDSSKETIEKLALERDAVKKWVGSQQVKKIIVVPNKIINIVVG
ncbi:MAG TPA: leucine--tRNA ligase [Candidatus Paceibacterota bacterium]|nr:leucine--tRNA ligase [Candidatus Paceibacterota bacterium]